MSVVAPGRYGAQAVAVSQMAVSSVNLSFQARFCINVASLGKEVREPWGKANRGKKMIFIVCQPVPALFVPEQSILKILQTSKGLLLPFASSAMRLLSSDRVPYKTVKICDRSMDMCEPKTQQSTF